MRKHWKEGEAKNKKKWKKKELSKNKIKMAKNEFLWKVGKHYGKVVKLVLELWRGKR